MPPGNERTSAPEVIIARPVTDSEGAKHFVTGSAGPTDLTDEAADHLVIDLDPETGAPHPQVTTGSFDRPGGEPEVVLHKDYMTYERLSWQEYIQKQWGS